MSETPITRVAALLNARRYGEVCTAEQLRALLVRLGIDPGAGKFPLMKILIALLKRSAADRRPSPVRPPSWASYEAHKDRVNTKAKAAREASSNIGMIPPPVDAARRERCRLDLAAFMRTYFPHTFIAEFSTDHLDVIARIQMAILEECWLLEAVYRGFGKTSIAEVAILWAVLYGHRRFCLLVGVSDDASTGSMGTIRTELEANDLLAEDFPEACLPVRMIRGVTQLANTQTYTRSDGTTERTRLMAQGDELRLPQIEGAASAGNVILCYGIGSKKIRGMKRKIGLESVRPDFAFLDDPQTDESAVSQEQVEKIKSIIERGILGSSGHFRGASCFMACTVIAPGDLVEKLLDQSQNPKWVGKRRKMVRSWSAEHDGLWQEYAVIRNTYTPGDLNSQKLAKMDATDFYRKNRAMMDAGADVSWEWCYSKNDGEISAIQHAYNIFFDKGELFFSAECQNEPITVNVSYRAITEAGLLAKIEPRLNRGTVPSWCDELVASVDIHDDMLFWMVMAGRKNDFRLHVVDYGTWPKQVRSNFTQGSGKGRATLQMKYKGAGKEGAIRAGLQDLTEYLAGRMFSCEDRTQRQISRIGYDSNYQTQMMYEFCAGDTRLRVPLAGTHDSYMSQRGFLDTPDSKTSRTRRGVNGTGYKTKPIENYRGLRLLTYEANGAKTFLCDRILCAAGDAGSLSICNGSRSDHVMLIQHWMAETASWVEGGKGREGWVWKNGRSDNHWWDTASYCCVLCSVLDFKVGGENPVTSRRVVRRVSFAERQKQMRGGN